MMSPIIRARVRCPSYLTQTVLRDRDVSLMTRHDDVFHSRTSAALCGAAKNKSRAAKTISPTRSRAGSTETARLQAMHDSIVLHDVYIDRSVLIVASGSPGRIAVAVAVNDCHRTVLVCMTRAGGASLCLFGLRRNSLLLLLLLAAALDHDHGDEGTDKGAADEDQNHGQPDRPLARREEVVQRVSLFSDRVSICLFRRPPDSQEAGGSVRCPQRA